MKKAVQTSRLVDAKAPFRPVYSIFRHESLGCLVSAHVVQELTTGRLSLVHQGLYPENFIQFEQHLDETDRKLVKMMADISVQAIVKKFNSAGKKPEDFFTKEFKDEKAKHILEMINRRMGEIMPMLLDREVYLMGNDGYPAQTEVKVLHEKATVLFHFKKLEDETRYYPTIKLRDQKIKFQFENAVLVVNDPAWILVGNEIFTFQKSIEANKLKPFLNKWYISIPPSAEEQYYDKFITHLLEKYEVVAEGFEIKTEKPIPFFQMVVEKKGNGVIGMEMEAKYGSYSFRLSDKSPVKTVRTKTENSYIFHRVIRDMKEEDRIREFIGRLSKKEGMFNQGFMEEQEALSWLAKNVDLLAKRGIHVVQHDEEFKLNFNTPVIEMETVDAGDWFDIKAIVRIGTFKIPFLKFKSNIIKGKRDFILPDGTTCILPESWFTDYRHLVEVAEEKDGDRMSIRKYQAGLLSGAYSGEGVLRKKLNALTGISTVEEQPLPKNIQASLRVYQRKGYDWLNFLRDHRLGGILADDMGLGKTLQTLSLLQREKEKGEAKNASLVVMPTSLIYNWQQEAAKFAPELRVFVFTGMGRAKDASRFDHYDVILTTYGLVRQDVEMLKEYPFHYVILDESQMIKNPSSKTSKAVKKLLARNRLSLTGTPIENSLTDLWSQISFLNPGLLGSETFFRDFYVTPIEKGQDEKRKENLRKIIHPFILRRTKEQVATELPPKVEQVLYCEMEEEQQKLYDETLNAYRNYLMSFQNKDEYNKNKLNILSGLQKLRQIAIHPLLVEEGRAKEAEMTSGKYDEFYRMLTEVIGEGSKVLIFSQFVKLLSIIKADLEKENISFAYLDGSTKDRQGVVERFQTDETVKPFLISLKAGGVGLNLTAAEYVFILDPWWNPAVENQAIDRTHRIGQTKTVFSYKFITRNSIEEKIVKLQEKKSKLSADIVGTDEDVFKKLELEDLKDLLG